MKKDSLSWWVGFLAFVVLFAAGFAWLLHWIPAVGNVFGNIKMVASIVLTVIALVFGWIWLRTTVKNKKLLLVLSILFVIFAVLAIVGFLGI
ncbi:hypothetical protein EI71_01961 [Anaeroplasma bactoclasticum]|jgi:phosphoglycerol transferase MdoB-like AlkP superfamily enzyme|uniref:Uncharacterized protein n=1 Tax=Anaeroplasma bactoclasticum TaxID=2088 RepID=A0A397QXX3_9MOLU|nr:hypothetical protein [Anaeroplasma bactoclasticum]RIA64745.1 hypothetical protein EI71_01961 [Anaeroplasma bactoclasticum]